ncbi:MAG: metalloregulator ArsR/SmtB family transcription factor [Myxococcales bacterium]|nr:metalloregulator ArsR/SmtB family transcription factor [Myxococcales bacterium]
MTDPVFDRLALLSEPLRVRLLRILERDELAVGEIARVLQVPQPTASRHIKQLQDAGWITLRRAGTASYFRLAELGVARALWDLVRREVDDADSSSVYSEDLRRLNGVVAARSGSGGEAFRRLRKQLFGEQYAVPGLLAMLPPDLVIADLGCGPGSIVAMLAPIAGRVLGLDREESILPVARERTAGMPNVEIVGGRMESLPWSAGTLDLAICALVLHLVDDLAPVCSEVARVLKPGGRWVILDMVEHDREEYRETMGHQHLGFSRAALEGHARRAGMSVQSWRVLSADPAALGPALFVGVVAAQKG